MLIQKKGVFNRSSNINRFIIKKNAVSEYKINITASSESEKLFMVKKIIDK